MHALWIAVVLFIAGLSTSAWAQSWEVHLVLIPEKSVPVCSTYQTFNYKLELQGSTLNIASNAGAKLVAAVGPDGTVRQDFKTPSGLSLTIAGNAQTRDLDIINAASKCQWKMAQGPGSCSQQNQRCEGFCQTQRPGLGDRISCMSDCSSRQTSCLNTGTYTWTNSPTVSGLDKN